MYMNNYYMIRRAKWKSYNIIGAWYSSKMTGEFIIPSQSKVLKQRHNWSIYSFS